MLAAQQPSQLGVAKIELGRQLYFDTRLSIDNTISCASCHDPAFGYAKDTQFGVGVGDQTGGRNSPVAYNRILSGPQFWDGRAKTLEEQALGPIRAAGEMNQDYGELIVELKAIPEYVRLFDKVFGKNSFNSPAQHNVLFGTAAGDFRLLFFHASDINATPGQFLTKNIQHLF